MAEKTCCGDGATVVVVPTTCCTDAQTGCSCPCCSGSGAGSTDHCC